MDAPPIAFRPLWPVEHRQRWPAAVVRIWDFRGIRQDDIPNIDRPGCHSENIFDFFDGLRLIVSMDRYDHGINLHVSASVREKTQLWRRLMRRSMTWAALDDLVRDRVQFLGGGPVAFSFATLSARHYYDPPVCLDAALAGG